MPWIGLEREKSRRTPDGYPLGKWSSLEVVWSETNLQFPHRASSRRRAILHLRPQHTLAYETETYRSWASWAREGGLTLDFTEH